MTEILALNQLALPKALTGIAGFDEISGGGLPRGRPTIVCGGAGCGKTLFAMEFLVRGILQYDEPGVFIAFEETRADLTQNVASLGFSLTDLIDHNQLVIDHININRAEVEQTGEYDLDGLFVRLEYAIQKVKAKRIVLDTLEALFTALGDTQMLRSELQRLFAWLKNKGVTAIITAERGDTGLTRHGIEEYVSDCVVLLDHRIENQMSTRRLRIIKYRGTVHGTDEYPFLIDENGFSVLPITSVGLDYEVSNERISSGIPRLDMMLDGQGFFRASTVLISGTAGTGKTTFVAQFVDAACQRGERCLFFSFEESAGQIIRNMYSVGINLQKWVDADLLRFKTARPTMYSLEMHLVTLHKHILAFNPHVVVMDPITNFDVIGDREDSRALLTRIIDFLKMRKITALMTSLTSAGEAIEQSKAHISSIVDTWLLVRNVESNGERNRLLNILKARGMAHSNQVSEFEITTGGIHLMDAYLVEGAVITGSARLAHEANKHDEELGHQQAIELRQLQLERKRAAANAQILALQAELDAENAEIQLLIDQDTRKKLALQKYADAIARKRQATPVDNHDLTHTVEGESHDE
ncbi:MAG: circadian clock protein KaiC [bacterium]|nr:circadian clock protein KaiC [bacterium]